MSTNGTVKKYSHPKDLLTEEQQDILRNKTSKIERLQSDISNLSKPLLQAEGSANWQKHVTPGTLSILQDEKNWEGVGPVKNKVGTTEFEQANGQSWNKLRGKLDIDSEDEAPSENGSPATTKLDIKELKTFGTMPMEQDVVVIKCNNCQRPFQASSFKAHIVVCMKDNNADSENRKPSKQSAIFSDDEDTEKLVKKKKKKTSLEDALDLSEVTAKRPPSASIEKPEKKKMKKEKQKKTAKQKAPLDLDKQCGVIQGPNNVPCTRSLTCKSHSMGAKRAVNGRSQSYDVLLAAYQKKAIGRPNSASGKSIKNLKKLQSQVSSPASTANGGPGPIANGNNTNGVAPLAQVNEEPYIDSDEEVESIMQALKQNRPAPLAEKPFYFTKRRRQCFRLRDILLDAITPKAPVTNEHIHSTMMPNMNDNNMGHGRQPYFQGVSGMNFPGNPGVDTMFGDSNNPSSASPSFSVR